MVIPVKIKTNNTNTKIITVIKHPNIICAPLYLYYIPTLIQNMSIEMKIINTLYHLISQ